VTTKRRTQALRTINHKKTTEVYLCTMALDQSHIQQCAYPQHYKNTKKTNGFIPT